MDVKQYRTSRGLKAKDIVSVIREGYPRYDKFLHSKIENPDCGVTLVPGAELLLTSAYGKEPQKRRRRDERRLPCRISARIESWKLERLQQRFLCGQTMQDFLYDLVTKVLEKENAPCGTAIPTERMPNKFTFSLSPEGSECQDDPGSPGD